MFQYSALLIVASAAPAISILIYALLKPESRLGKQVHNAADTHTWSEFFDAFEQMRGRMIPTISMTALVLLNMFVASSALPESDIEDLRTLFDLGIITIGAHEVIAYLMIFWMMAPLLAFFATAPFSDKIRSEVGQSSSN